MTARSRWSSRRPGHVDECADRRRDRDRPERRAIGPIESRASMHRDEFAIAASRVVGTQSSTLRARAPSKSHSTAPHHARRARRRPPHSAAAIADCLHATAGAPPIRYTRGKDSIPQTAAFSPSRDRRVREAGVAGLVVRDHTELSIRDLRGAADSLLRWLSLSASHRGNEIAGVCQLPGRAARRGGG